MLAETWYSRSCSRGNTSTYLFQVNFWANVSRYLVDDDEIIWCDLELTTTWRTHIYTYSMMLIYTISIKVCWLLPSNQKKLYRQSASYMYVMSVGDHSIGLTRKGGRGYGHLVHHSLMSCAAVVPYANCLRWLVHLVLHCTDNAQLDWNNCL